MKKNKNIFADIKNMTTFVVQNRGVEQLVARRAHNPEAGGSSPSPATKQDSSDELSFFYPYEDSGISFRSGWCHFRH